MKLAHFSDTHLGYKRHQVRSTNGNNQREEDFARSYLNTIRSIKAEDPDIVIMSGDLLEAPIVPMRALIVAKKGALELTRRPDGRPRPVIFIAGNHDAPRDLKEATFLDLLREDHPHLYPVARGYEQITLEDYPGLENVCVHALPHDSLDILDELGPVAPNPDYGINILVSHGVAEASELYKRAVGRESSIPVELMQKSWDYVALGHFHKQGPVNLTGRGENTNSRVWYAGSTDFNGFGDASQVGTHNQRGWLLVAVDRNRFEVHRKTVTVRAHINLPIIDCEGMTPEQISEKLVANVRNCENRVGAVIRQKLLNISSDIWHLVNTYPARAAADDAMFYKFDPRYSRTQTADDGVQAIQGMAGVGAVLGEVVAALIPEGDREAVSDFVLHKLGESLSVSPTPAAPDTGSAVPVSEPDPDVSAEPMVPNPGSTQQGGAANSVPEAEPAAETTTQPVGPDDLVAPSERVGTVQDKYEEPADPAGVFAAMNAQFGRN